MKTRRTFMMRAVPAIGLVLALAACSGEAGTASTDEGAAEAATFRFGINFEPDNWDPMLVPNTTYTQLAYEGLMSFAQDGITIEPALAEEWTLTSPTELTLTLREGVVFHDGTPFDAEAVAANIEHIQASGTEWSSSLEVIEEVQADGMTVTLQLSEPNPSLPFNLAGRGAVMISPAAIEDGSWQQAPVGTGPYTLNQEETVDSSVYVFDRFDDYYATEEVNPDRVEIYFMEDGATRYNALSTGQVDAARIDPAMTAEAESAGYGTVTWPALAYHLFFFDRGGVFADPLVRQAICYAMPTDDIDAAAYEGTSTFPTQRLNENDPGYAPDIEGYTPDLARAQELMAEAGNPAISFQMPFMAGQEATYALIQESFGALGIELELLPMNGSQYFSEYFTGDYPLIFNQANSEDGGMYNYYNVRFAQDGDLNPDQVPPPAELAALYEQAIAAADADEQNALFQEMSRVVHDEALDCGYMNIAQTIAYDTEVIGDLPVTQFAPSAVNYKDVEFLD